jgi:beta-lactam-binding protein with PASTA domain
VAITTLNDLEPGARYSAEKITRLLTGYEPTGEEPLIAIFEGAFVRLSVQSKQLEHLATRPMPMVTGMPLAAAEIVIRSATGASHIDVDRDPRAHGREDTVIAQTPVPGTHVSRSDQIRLVASADESD